MAKKHGKKEVQVINLHSDAREMLHKQASSAGVSISTYIERIILEKNILQKREEK